MFSNLKQRWKSYRAYKDTVNELHRLGARELADLGISRSDIHFIAKESAYR